MMKKIAQIACGVWISIFAGFSAFAGSSYLPVYQVNDSVITKFEIDQRIKMLRAFGTKGNLQTLSVEQLIDDRLRLQAAKMSGITTTEYEITSGGEEFATRGKLTLDQLYDYLRERGVHRESFNEFVRAGLLWRNVIGARFASKVNVSDDEVDATLDVGTISFPKTVLVAEIILPIKERGRALTQALADRLVGNINSELQFSIAAKKYSKSPTAKNGGSMGWLPLASLPATASARISALETGQLTTPVNMAGTIAIYQLRGVREAKSAGEQVLSVTYLQVAMPGNKSGRDGQIAAATKLINSGDTCLDMQANSAGFGEAAVSIQSFAASALPADIAAVINNLDPNEATHYVTQSGAVNVIMLCSRAKDLPEGARDQIRNALFNRRVTSFGQGYLQELRGDAIITKK